VARARASPLAVERLVARTADRDRSWARERGLSPPSIRMEQEPGSAGKAVIDHYGRDVLASFAFRGVRSTGSKQTRAEPVAARAEAGDIRICRGRWTSALLDELTAFPLGAHDDQVDALSGAYEVLARRGRPVPVALIGDRRPSYWRI
jgi:predicted phage terminase large subunit-like protein